MDDREAAAAKIQVILNLTWFLYIVVDFWLFSIVWLENVFFVLFLWTFSCRNFLIVKKRVLQGDFHCCLWSFLLKYILHTRIISFTHNVTLSMNLWSSNPMLLSAVDAGRLQRAQNEARVEIKGKCQRGSPSTPKHPQERPWRLKMAQKLSQNCENVSL